MFRVEKFQSWFMELFVKFQELFSSSSASCLHVAAGLITRIGAMSFFSAGLAKGLDKMSKYVPRSRGATPTHSRGATPTRTPIRTPIGSRPGSPPRTPSDPDLEAVRLLSQGLGVDFIHELNKQKMTESACAEKLFSTFRS